MNVYAFALALGAAGLAAMTFLGFQHGDGSGHHGGHQHPGHSGSGHATDSAGGHTQGHGGDHHNEPASVRWALFLSPLSLRSRVVPLLLASSVGCAPTRPAFVEPSWGDAPPPSPEQIAEITLHRSQCRGKCRSTQVKLRRDGGAEMQYLTSGRSDSLFYASLDSTTFRRLATQLVVDSLFQGNGADPGVLEPFSTSGTVVSASILCRRFVDQWDERSMEPSSRPARITASIDSVIRHLAWRRCCKA